MEFICQKKAFISFMVGMGCLSFINLSYATLPLPNEVTSNAIAGGSYVTFLNTLKPLLAITENGGTTWHYPSSVISSLPDDLAWRAAFAGASCSNMNCLGAGYYESFWSVSNHSNIYPLLSVSHDAGKTWTSPGTVISSLPVGFVTGKFNAAPWCSGNNCIAVGDYFGQNAIRNTQRFPLLASSHDAGSTWQYPSTILSNLPTDFSDRGYFSGATCVATDCLAVGRYKNTLANYFPLLSNSHDGGNTWNYPSTVISNLPNDFANKGVFNAASCSTATCVAVGEYITSKPGAPQYPLLAISQDNGSTWRYPAVAANLPNDFISTSLVSSVSCNANNCIAVGQYESSQAGNLQYPLLLSSQDSGSTWSSRDSIINNLPSDFENKAVFYGASCNRNICIAVGEYQSKDNNGPSLPLLASSLDGGVTWSYPTSVKTEALNLLNGKFLSVSCNVTDCVAQGQYQNSRSNFFYPLIAVSHDAGVTWFYPSSVISNLPDDYYDEGVFYSGNSSFTSK